MPFQASSLSPPDQFPAFVRAAGAALRANESLPDTLKQWDERRTELRERLLRSFGRLPKTPCPLEPKVVGELKRDGYRVEKLLLQTQPGIQMTANAYVPSGAGIRPAVLGVHGHWRGAKQDPVVQARCIGLAKLGFFVLAVDAFGAGERAIGKALGEYHGEMTAATLFPLGLTLAGLQVYDNMRAVDYLQSRPEVDAAHIGVTGASGGGNQTMYAGACDERFGCVVPTCSVGTYQSYLTAACCMCELVPGALTYTEEWGILALTAPRALMVISATQDAFQFSVGEAKKSLAKAQRIFELHGRPEKLKHAIFESKHDYSRPMREAMYGWMTLHLKGEGDGSPISDPAISVEEPETLRCFPGESRPAEFVTLPQFAAAEGRNLLAGSQPPDHIEHWESSRDFMLESLRERVFGRFPIRTPVAADVSNPQEGVEVIAFEPEPGIPLEAHRRDAQENASRLAILLYREGRAAAESHPLAEALHEANWDVVTIDLRATGALAMPNDAIMNAPDHNTAQWSIWIGRPLLGQWLWDVRRSLDALEATDRGLPKETAVIGIGPMGLVALCAAALDRRISKIATVETLASYVSDAPYRGQCFGIIAPGILRAAGDVEHLAALSSPRPLIIAGGLKGNGEPIDSAELSRHFEFTRGVYELQKAGEKISILLDASAQAIIERLNA